MVGLGTGAMQRIESGELRGRRLKPLPSGVAGLRPTAARVRGAIYDRLAADLPGAKVLDLFAGSGAMSIEALSRGAASATMIELSAKVVRHLHTQLAELGLGPRTRVVQGQAEKFLRATTPSPFDLVIVDPPFATPAVFGPLCEALVQGWLTPDAIIVCERERVRGKTPVVQWPAQLELEAEKVYGQAAVEFLRVRAPSSDDPLENPT